MKAFKQLARWKEKKATGKHPAETMQKSQLFGWRGERMAT